MNHLVTMGRTALRALALRWFIKGFLLSGDGFNGERCDLEHFPVLRALLEAEFERCWAQRHKEHAT